MARPCPSGKVLQDVIGEDDTASLHTVGQEGLRRGVKVDPRIILALIVAHAVEHFIDRPVRGWGFCLRVQAEASLRVEAAGLSGQKLSGPNAHTKNKK